MTIPQLWVVAGPNGAGKSTLISDRLHGRLPFVNPDDIARRISPTDFDNPRNIILAGRQALKERRAHLAALDSFAIETTLTGNSALDLISTAKTLGYKINLIFVGLDDVALSMARVALRVRAGGHRVPARDLLRRFSRSIENLTHASKLVDRLWVLDNSGLRRRLVLSSVQHQPRLLSAKIPEWVPADVLNNLRKGL
ncbi:AAA family ATPase [Achromobacter sp. Bel]|uniref:AAA family ATPase n=1 Tax=Achromobacter sp. Bel TaxID=2727415 RepID=UPI001B7D51A4|nr:AAA family ATPase [Achromobacter sp. Bel]